MKVSEGDTSKSNSEYHFSPIHQIQQACDECTQTISYSSTAPSVRLPMIHRASFIISFCIIFFILISYFENY